MEPVIGQTVRYVLSEGPNAGQHRPAFIVRLWDAKLANLQVITDSPPTGDSNDMLPPMLWKTSIRYDETGNWGTWHFVPRSQE